MSVDLKRQLNAWIALTRLDKPVGIYLLLWPTWWALWLAADGFPEWKNLLIFSLGVVLMRSAGCVINDFADRKVDGHVKRTADRPLATGAISPKAALVGFALMCLLAFVLVLFTNTLTIMLSVGGVILAFIYPFMKRYTHMPQLFLGAAFSWSIPMAFAAEAGELPAALWLLYVANLSWTVAYDTFYAMVDRDDDLKIGVKSTAILFGKADLLIIGLLHLLALVALLLAAAPFGLNGLYVLALLLGTLFCGWLIWLARDRGRDTCFRAFKLSHWFGLIVLTGMVVG